MFSCVRRVPKKQEATSMIKNLQNVPKNLEFFFLNLLQSSPFGEVISVRRKSDDDSTESELTSPGHIKFLQAPHSGVFPSSKPFMNLQIVGCSSEVQIRKL